MVKDKLILNSLEDLGFSKFDFNQKDLLDNFQRIYDKHFHDLKLDQDIMVSHNKVDPEKALQVHNELSEAASSFLNNTFRNFQIVASHFVVKKGKSETSFQLHQDWNANDESQSKSLKVWIPLEASYPENGGLCFVPQSHEFYNNYRSGSLGLPQFEITKTLRPYLSYLRLFPGEAALFYNNTLHGSLINATEETRVAVIFNLIEKDSQALYYHKSGEGQIQSYALTTETLLKNLPELEKGKLPDLGEALDTFDADLQDYSSWTEKGLIDKIRSFNGQNGRAHDYEHKMYRILKNEQLENLINKEGYAIIDLLDDRALELFRTKFNEIYPDRTKYTGLYSSMMHVPHKERKKLHDFTMETLKPCLEKYVENYASPISLFYSRRPDKEYFLEWHNDPSIMLNQHVEPLYGVWFPLQNLNPESGTLKIIPGSHRLLNKLIFTYNTFKWPLEDKRELLEEYGISFKLKAGQALIYDARMVHSSDPNLSEIDRDNVMIRLNHERSKYFKISTKSIIDNHDADLYKQDKDFFFSEAVDKHELKPETGEYKGKIAMFYQELSEEYVKESLAPYVQSEKVKSKSDY